MKNEEKNLGDGSIFCLCHKKREDNSHYSYALEREHHSSRDLE